MELRGRALRRRRGRRRGHRRRRVRGRPLTSPPLKVPFGELLDWIAIPSVSGSEGDYGDALARALERRGLSVERQELGPGRANLVARAASAPPELVFCTHLDTVPPWYGPREDREHVHGRGACDAKGQAAAMLAALEQLTSEGEERVGMLLTVGEEETSDGARHADARVEPGTGTRWVIVGEPTGNTFVRAHKGLLKARLVASGVAGHSSQDVGPSAIHELARVACRLIDLDWGSDPVLGRGTINLGRIEGGVAANVVAEHAALDLMVRTVEPPEAVLLRLRAELGSAVRVEDVHKGTSPVRFFVPEGEDAVAVAFGTDAPYLGRFGTPLLFGAGSILDAHTEHEKVSKRDLETCAARHVRTARSLLAAEVRPGLRS